MFNKRKTAALFIDLTKAFDTVNIELLLRKICNLGINQKALAWLTSFLYERKQYVCINRVESESLRTTCGVPQGSILGPILFLLFINDVVELPLSGKPFLFADDIAITYNENSDQNIEASINRDLHILQEWFFNNKLIMNTNKTKFMRFYKGDDLTITCNGASVEEVDQYTYLGVILDKQLNFQHHLDAAQRRLSSVAGVFRKIGIYLDDKTKKMVYFSLFHSRMLYGITIWGHSSKTRIAELQITQNKAIKNLYGLDRRESTKLIHLRYDLLTVDLLYEHQLLNITHNIINEQIHSNTTYIYNHNTHGYGTRNRENIYIEKIHPKSIKYNSIISYNKIPSILKNENKVQFKKISRELVKSRSLLYQ